MNLTENCACNYGKYSYSGNSCSYDCSYKCGNCHVSTGDCIECSSALRDPLDSCDCIKGYYEDSRDCVCKI